MTPKQIAETWILHEDWCSYQTEDKCHCGATENRKYLVEQIEEYCQERLNQKYEKIALDRLAEKVRQS